MTIHIHQFEFSYNQQVKIKALELNGRIDRLAYGREGNMYRVVYWAESARNAEWMYAWEIEEVNN